jgi:aminoglycoside phosphotransferase (APT) family kinase protein
VQIDTSLVEALLAEQCPALEGLPLTPTTNGWDNAVYRLGDSLTVRLPRRAQAAPMLENEITWLPIIAPLLTLPVPQPVYAGHPGCSYPYSWMVAPWFDGTRAASAPLASRTAFASELADFLWTLHAPAPAHAPINPFRGMSLAQEGPDTRARARIARERERDGLLRRWESWVSAPDFDDVDMWLHGDLHPANLVMAARRSPRRRHRLGRHDGRRPRLRSGHRLADVRRGGPGHLPRPTRPGRRHRRGHLAARAGLGATPGSAASPRTVRTIPTCRSAVAAPWKRC